jgi:hypothetical protein
MKTERKTDDLLGKKYKKKIVFLSTLFFVPLQKEITLFICIVYRYDTLSKLFRHRSVIVLHK